MEQTTIERVDNLPLLIAWMDQMQLAATIDQHWQPHRGWTGLSYGQLTVLFIAFILHQREHRLSYFEDWLQQHQHVIHATTGWTVGPKEGTDDRLGILLQTLGSNPAVLEAFHQQHGQHLVHAYALPTQVARFDTTSFNVYHAPPEPGQPQGELLRFGYSKDQRPDLLQFKQALGTLDPAGVPLVSQTLPGNSADDPLYIPAWYEFRRILGHVAFLFVGDAKGGNLLTRATIAHEDGSYLFPLAMTGEVPTLLREWLARPPTAIRPLSLPTSVSDPTPREVGKGFTTWRTMHATLDDGTPVTWRERYLVTYSPAQAQQQQERLHKRLERAEAALRKLKPQKDERAAGVLARATTILERHTATELLQVTVRETAVTRRRSSRRGRPSATTPVTEETRWQVQITVERNADAIAAEERVLGWRIYVTNTRKAELTHAQALGHYRGQWIAEHGYHRFKQGAIPALPLLIRVPERIIGLLLVLLLALQVLTLLELVARRTLAERAEEIAGLVPGNRKMKTARPTAERLLAAFSNLHLLVQHTGDGVRTHLVEELSPLQRAILELLHLDPSWYDLTVCMRMPSANEKSQTVLNTGET
jgi:transposase